MNFFAVPGQETSLSKKAYSAFEETQPYLKCWEITDDSINSIASDNNILISKSDGSISFIDYKGKERLWNLQIGSNLISNAFLKKESLFVVSYPRNPGSGEISTVRRVEKITGITDWVKNFDNLSDLKLIGITDDSAILIGAAKSGGTDLQLINLSDGTTIRETKLNFEAKITTVSNASMYLLKNENEIIFVGLSDGKEKTIKPGGIKNISAMASIGGEIILGDCLGAVYKLRPDSFVKEKLFRTGGEISHIIPLEHDFLAVSNDNFLYYYSEDHRKVIWKKRLPGRVSFAPVFFEKKIFAYTSADPAVYILSQNDGSKQNQINLDEAVIPADLQVNENGIFLLTNRGLFRYDDSCK